MSSRDFPSPRPVEVDRRTFLRGAALGVATAALPLNAANASVWSSFFQKHFIEMDENDRKRVIERLKGEARERFGADIQISATKAPQGVKFGYALDLSRCIGCRRCVYGCAAENNPSRNPQIHWISVLRAKKEEKWVDLQGTEKYYDPPAVPEADYFYIPVQCQQCENPPCVKVCPTKATWKEPDGIVVVDYNWCIGCRYCIAACPYGARHFNWSEPSIAREEINPQTHYLGNRPRHKGVVEKCTFCIQRTREGRYPACVEVCPAGARKFGNLLDEKNEIRHILERKRVFRLKEDLNTVPTFFYFFGS